MKVKNETHYNTRDLGKVLRAACKAVGCKGKQLTVTVVYAQRHGWVTGNALLGHLTQDFPSKLVEGRRMRLRLPFDVDKLKMADLCWVAMHEAQHLMGIRHRGMSTAMMQCHKQPLPAWAKDLQVRVKDMSKEPCSPEQRQERARTAAGAAAAKREASARKAFDKWLKAERHAAIMRRKWAKKVAYYDRRAAAKNAAPD